MNEFEKILAGIKVNPALENPLIVPAFEEFFTHLENMSIDEMPLVSMVDLFSNGRIRDIVRNYPNKEVLKIYTPNLLTLVESMK